MINNKAIRLTCVPTLILALFVAFCFPLQAKGSEGFPAEEELVEELAAQLEFLMEEALVVENGLRTFDFEKIEDEFGKEVRDEIEMLTVGLQPVENTKSRKGNFNGNGIKRSLEIMYDRSYKRPFRSSDGHSCT